MAGTPSFKVYNSNGQYIAACKYAEDAACLVGNYGDGSTIRYDHRRTVWTEGSEDFSASESYDGVRELIWERMGWEKAA